MSSSATSQSRDHHHHAAHRSMAGLAPLGDSCLWGGMYVVSKASFANIPPVTLGLLRLLIGSITLSILLWFANRRQSKPEAASLSPQARKRLPWLEVCIAISIITQSLGLGAQCLPLAFCWFHGDSRVLFSQPAYTMGEKEL